MERKVRLLVSAISSLVILTVQLFYQYARWAGVSPTVCVQVVTSYGLPLPWAVYPTPCDPLPSIILYAGLTVDILFWILLAYIVTYAGQLVSSRIGKGKSNIQRSS